MKYALYVLGTVIVLAVVGFGGYYIYNMYQTKNTTPETGKTTTQTQVKVDVFNSGIKK